MKALRVLPVTLITAVTLIGLLPQLSGAQSIGCSSLSGKTFSGSPPVANAGSDQFVDLGSTNVLLDGSASYDADNPSGSLTFRWRSSDVAVTVVNGARVKVVLPQRVGSFRFVLTVTDPAGNSCRDDVVVTVLEDVMSAVFVSAVFGNDSNDGAPQRPVQTLDRALELAAPSLWATIAGVLPADLYVGAGDYSPSSTLRVNSGQSVYGGFTVVERPGRKTMLRWVRDHMGDTTIHGHETALKVMDVTAPTVIDGLRILAAHGRDDHPSQWPKPGGNWGNSVGVYVRNAPHGLVISNNVIAAGSGSNGAPGENGRQGDHGYSGRAGGDEIHSTSHTTGSPGALGGVGGPYCGTLAIGDLRPHPPRSGYYSGGRGGNGRYYTSGEGGQPGQGPAGGGSGLPGSGGGFAWSAANGASGGNGSHGVGGLGGDGSGAIPDHEWWGSGGRKGRDGAPGSGGGGGAAGIGLRWTRDLDFDSSGAGGGGGGAGGCGGKGGGGGYPGGGSFGIYLSNASPLISGNTIASASGGNGGRGGNGGPGGTGGAGGRGGAAKIYYVEDGPDQDHHPDPYIPNADDAPGGDGGTGGKGGSGGGGGGGGGGVSCPIAITESSAPDFGVNLGVNELLPGSPGQGGAGGSGVHAGAPGQEGKSCIPLIDSSTIIEIPPPPTGGNGTSINTTLPPGLGGVSFGWAAWRGSDVVMTLVTPSGLRIGPETTNPDVQHKVGATFEIYQIFDPEPGNWTIELTGAGVPSIDEQVVVGVTRVPITIGR